MNQLKVAHVMLLKEMGGFENILCDFLTKPMEGIQFFVFSPHQISPFWQEKLISMNIPFHSGDKSLGKQWKYDLIKYARKNQIDIIHSHIRVRKFFLKTGAKVILEHCHGTVEIHSCFQILEDRFNKRYIDGVIAVSSAIRLMLIKRVHYRPDQVKVINNGINFERLKVTAAVPHPDRKTVITSIGRLVPVKGLEVLLNALPIIVEKKPGVEVWIVGDGRSRKDLETLAIRNGVSGYVRFWGSQYIVGNFLASTNILVMPSIRESFGNVLLEAGYFGIPSIASNIDGITDIITDNVNGILIEPRVKLKKPKGKARKAYPYKVVNGKTKKLQEPLGVDPNDLAKAILELIDSPEKCKRLGENARKRVIDYFNVERYRHDTVSFYQKMLDEKEKRYYTKVSE